MHSDVELLMNAFKGDSRTQTVAKLTSDLNHFGVVEFFSSETRRPRAGQDFTFHLQFSSVIWEVGGEGAGGVEGV